MIKNAKAVLKDKSLKRAVLKLASVQEIKWIKIFGSRARGENDKRSDYDIAINFESDDISKWEDIKENLDSATPLPLDIINYDKAGKEIRSHIDNQGILILWNKPWYVSMIKLGDAIDSLEEVVNDEDDTKHKTRDSVLTRFVYVLECFWKTFKQLEVFLGDGQEKSKFSRDAIKRAYQVGWIDDGNIWLKMLEDRNDAVHNYDEEKAEEVFAKVRGYFKEIKDVYEKLKNQYFDSVKV